jgi:hypothetical protein
MACHFETDETRRILRCQLEGFVSGDSLRDFIFLATRFANQYDLQTAILDLSGVSTFDISPQVIRELASLPPVIKDRETPRFIIAPSPSLYGLARMFELLGQETRPNLHVVRTPKEVWVILGIPEPKFVPLVEPEEDSEATGA